MSDEDRDIDIESDEEDDTVSSTGKADLQFASQAEKRAHHNALERKRRDHIKDSFTSLRESVPTLQGEKASRAQILKKAADYIEYMRRKNSAHQRDIDDLKKQNNTLETQIEAMEKTKAAGEYSDMTTVQDLDRLTEDNLNPSDGEETESEEDIHDTKRQKVSA